MKRFIAFLVCYILSVSITMAQSHKWEFNYFALEFGLINGFTAAPDTLHNFFVDTESGDVAIYPNQNIEYVPGGSFGIQFHHDFKNDKVGLIFGLLYNNSALKATYSSVDKNYHLKEIHRSYSLGVPILLKFSSEIYNNQFYFYFGAQINYNFGGVVVQKLNTETEKLRSKIDNGALNKFTIPILAGFNYRMFNLRVGVMPQNFLNHDYQMTITDGDNSQKLKPYNHLTKSLVYLQLSMVVPLSQWTTNRSYMLSKIF